MPTIDCNAKEALIRFAAAGPPGAGKTQVLWKLHAGLPREIRTDLMMKPIGADQIVSFDFTPAALVPVADYKARCRLVTVPGRIAEPGIFQRVMGEIDGILFVVDSQCERLGENADALRQLAAIRGIAEVPVVILYNKRDLPNAAPVAALDRLLNRAGAPWFETVATKGEGLGAALSELFRIVVG